MSQRSRDRLLAWTPALLFLVAGWCWRWTCDDAFIDYRVVRNLLDGAGPVFNPGERVEAFTSPLWVALLALAALPWRLAGARVLPLEWISVLLGLGASAIGVGAAGQGWLRLARDRGDEGPLVPLAGWLIVALPASWAFATSGLETGLITAWMGLSFWSAAARRPSSAVLIGLGPLVRPDLAVVALGLMAMLALSGPRTLSRLFSLAARAAALPLAYQIFRMGYYASLVPNTALAKEAFTPYWSRGWSYLVDFVLTYFLWVPLPIFLVALHPWRALRRDTTWPVVLSGGLHALVVTRWGGDFMHARMLLPSWLALLLPVGASLRGSQRWAVVMLGAWATTCAIALRSPLGGEIGPEPIEIADERQYYLVDAGVAHPILAEDYVADPHGPHRTRTHSGDRDLYVQWGRCFESRAAARPMLMLWVLDRGSEFDCAHVKEMPLAPGRSRAAAVIGNIGISGWGAPHVHIADMYGLSDPLVARFRLPGRGRPGHEKHLANIRAWMVARFADPAAPVPEGPIPLSPDQTAAARKAVGCGDLAELLAAVDEPLTPRRFVRNLLWAARLTRLRIAGRASDARRELCGH